jgi:hypothetical protein
MKTIEQVHKDVGYSTDFIKNGHILVNLERIRLRNGFLANSIFGMDMKQFRYVSLFTRGIPIKYFSRIGEVEEKNKT